MNKDFLELIKSRTSVREFTGEPIPKEDILEIIKAGMSAPTARDIRPWAFIPVTDRKLLDELCNELPYAKMLDKASCAIIVCGQVDNDNGEDNKLWVCDCSAASENILLAAHAMGYGSVWTAAYPHSDRMDTVRKILSIPENIVPLNVIPIGIQKDKNLEPKDKFNLENIHWEKW